MPTFNESFAVKCRNGIFVGARKDKAACWLGVPYAKQPVGKLRWQAPKPPESSDKIFPADIPPVMPLQPLSGDKKFSPDKIGEDCLKLNIWLNADNRDDKKPVMFYFHGGGYLRGTVNAPLLNGENFVSNNSDVILIVVEHRLGVLGFVDFDGVAGGENFPDSSCLGLLDQVAALKWVNENISEFGGDPDNVTIFGHSSGASSCSFLMGMAEARRYFNRCIAHSGSVFFSHSKKFCRRLAPALLNVAGKKNAAELMALSTEEIFDLLPALNKFCTFPERDGKFLPTNMFERFERGDTKNIDLLCGTAADEINMWMLLAPNLETFHAGIAKVVAALRQQLDADDNARIKKFLASHDEVALLNEIIFRQPMLKQARLHSKAGGKTFVYQWRIPTGSDDAGAFHTAEMMFVFGNPVDNYKYQSRRFNPALLKKIQRMWINFAKNGNPSIDDLNWPTFDEANQKVVAFDKNICVEEIHDDDAKILAPILDREFDMLVL